MITGGPGRIKAFLNMGTECMISRRKRILSGLKTTHFVKWLHVVSMLSARVKPGGVNSGGVAVAMAIGVKKLGSVRAKSCAYLRVARIYCVEAGW